MATGQQGTTGPTMKRRGLIAGAAALIAGIAAQRAAQPVSAVNPPVLLGQDNTPTTNVATSVTAPSGFGGGSTSVFFANASASATNASVDGVGGSGGPGGAGLRGLGGTNAGAGVVGTGGTQGNAVSSGTGVIGIANGATPSAPGNYGPVGVYGTNKGLVAGHGVVGESNGEGVFGTGATGVRGVSQVTGGAGVVGDADFGVLGYSGMRAGGIAVQGHIFSTSTAANTTAVSGLNEGTGMGSIGVQGQARGIGVYGLSSGSYGIVGITSAGAPFSGITGGANTPGAAAFAGGTSTPGCYAAYFTGPVVVDGSFTVVNPANKHGAIKHPDGTYRLLYSMESPESWIEDFGTGALVNGRADVPLDPDFAAVAQTGDYHVFLTEYDRHSGLYVTTRAAGGFVVQAEKAGASGAFSWRIVAKPKVETKVQRLGKFAMPNLKIPTVNDLPKPTAVVPAPPQKP
jgi:hypothetical protein